MRFFDPPDAANPQHDLTTLYARSLDGEAQLRLELLDHASLPDYDLYLAFDLHPGGATNLPVELLPGRSGAQVATRTALDWDLLLFIPASGPLQVVDSHLAPVGGTRLSVVRRPDLAWLSISLDLKALGAEIAPWGQANYAVQVFLHPAGEPQPADSLGPVRSDAAAPAPARLLLAFWNTYPAYTPATALRRWDGAHTGPLGGRHGLYNLLRTAHSAGAPLFLLDLTSPPSLSALDFSGYLPQVQAYAHSGLLSLPQALPDPAVSPLPLLEEMASELLAQDRRTASRFGLPASQALFAPAGWVPQGAPGRLVFVPQPGASSLQAATPYRWGGYTYLPLPGYGDPQAAWQPDSAGLPLEARRALLATALASTIDGGPQPLLVGGGALPASAWGDPQVAREAFRYLNARPWIQIIDETGLLSMPAAARPPQGFIPPSPPAPTDAPEAWELLQGLRLAPENALKQAAWGVVRTLYAPVYPTAPTLPDLRRQSLPQTWTLLDAAHWAANPISKTDCTSDPDHDGQPECILASEKFYLLVEIDSGVLTHAFWRSDAAPGEANQIIGPSTQVISGLSDAPGWKLDGGIFADPAAIPGAFADDWRGFQPQTGADELLLRSPDGAAVKSYRLTGNRLELRYEPAPGQPAPSLRLPLLLDPWQRFAPGWAAGYQALPGDQGFTWQAAGLNMRVMTDSPNTLATFLDSRPFFAATENPNLDYPAGHTLPLPLALIGLYPLAGQPLVVQLESETIETEMP